MQKVLEFLNRNKSSINSVLKRKGENVYVFNPKDLIKILEEPMFCEKCQEIKCECQ